MMQQEMEVQTKRPMRRRRTLGINEIVKYLEEGGINVPYHFPDVVKNIKKEGDISRITEKDFIEIMKIAEFWKPVFVEKSGYDKFVLSLFITAYRIHCIAVSTNPELNNYVGKYSEVDVNHEFFKETYIVTTIMSLGGNASFSGCSSKYHFE